jgi:tetratricopeptide (TPR) repeat protein
VREAGDRAFALNAFPAAARYYALAGELWPRDDPERAELLFRLARAHHVAGDERRAEALERALEELIAAGRDEQAAEAEALLAEVWWYRKDRERCDSLLDSAAARVADLPDSAAKALVLSQVARYRMLADENEDAILIGQEALAMAERLGLDELRSHALTSVVTAKANRGEADAIATLERSVELAFAIRSPEAARALNNLASVEANLGDLGRQGELLAEAVRVGEELGARAMERFSRAHLAGNLFWRGHWDEGLHIAESWLAEGGQESSSGELGIRRNRARVLLARDDVDGALEDMARAVEGSRQMREPQALLPALGVAVRTYLELGREVEARKLAAELLEHVKGSTDWRILDFAFVAERLGYADALRPLVERLPKTPMRAANLALVAGEYDVAANILQDIGMLFAAADARRLAAAKLASWASRRSRGTAREGARVLSIGRRGPLRQGVRSAARRARGSRVAPARARSTRTVP